MTPLPLPRLPRHSALALAVAGLLLLVVAGTATVRFSLWAAMPYRGHGSSSVIVEIPPGVRPIVESVGLADGGE